MRKMLFSLLLFCCLPCMAQVANQFETVLPAIAQTAATVNSPTQQNFNFRGGHFVVYVSAYTSGTYTPHIQGYDAISGQWYDILVGTGISAIGENVVKIYPGISGTTNVAANDILPSVWRVQLIGTSTPAMTISVGVFLEL
jgi:hypothetical protein